MKLERPDNRSEKERERKKKVQKFEVKKMSYVREATKKAGEIQK